MDIKLIKNKCQDRFWGKLPNEKEHRWVLIDELKDYDTFIIVGDNGGDDFITFPNKNNIESVVKNILYKGYRIYDFQPTIRCIVCNGELKDFIVKLI